MAKNPSASAPRCPTCPQGHCPRINTEPTSPEPSGKRIASAERAIPDVLSEEFHVDRRQEARASQLVVSLRKRRYGAHKQAAAEWAVHRLIQRKMLSAHLEVKVRRAAPLGRPIRQCENGQLVRPSEDESVRVYGSISDPANFDSFVVRAEESLWSWWRAQDQERELFPHETSVEANLKFTPTELFKEMRISRTTLNTYAKNAGVKTPPKGGPRRWYSQSDRARILNWAAVNAPQPISARARELLENIARESKKDPK